MKQLDTNFCDMIRRRRIIAILRHLPEDQLIPVFRALAQAGIQLIEITMNTAAAARQIAQAQEHFSDRLIIGAGTVSTPARAREALAAGARFLVTPNLDLQVVRVAQEADCPVIPGVLTPTEMMTAVNAGVSVLKLFPAARMGLGYLKDILAPLDDLNIIAVGGITAENALDWLHAGCIAVGMGSALVSSEHLQSGDYETLQTEVRQLVDKLTC